MGIDDGYTVRYTLNMNTTTKTVAKTFKNNWAVKCYSCGAEYVDHRRRVGKCLECESAAVIVTRVSTTEAK